MEKLLASPQFLAAAGGGLFLLLSLLFLLRRNRKGSDEPAYLQQVRALVAEKRYEEAAEIQAKRGHKKEAYNLLERGGIHHEASHLAEELGLQDRAAYHAEQAGAFRRAAQLYAQLGKHDQACQLYLREGLFAEAAEALEKQPNADLQRLAQLWEQALITLFNALGNLQQLPPQQLQHAQQMAEKSAIFYEKAGNLARAAQLYGISQNQTKVQQLQAQIQANPIAATLMGQPSDPMNPNAYAGSPLHLPTSLGTPLATGMPGAAGMPGTPMSAGIGLTGDALTTISQMVNSAVQTAIQQGHGQAPVQVNLEGDQVQQLLDPERLKGTGVHINVIHVPDAASNSSTPVERESERYTIGEMLGEGGMAVVYKAFDRVLEREVALKFLPEGVTQTPLALRYFEREAKAAAALSHPNIVTIYDYGLLSGRPFICMELLQGASLDRLLEQTNGQGMPLLSIFEIAEGLLSALDVAHAHNFVHRDVKPANLMYTHQHVIKLMDFGIARQGDASQKTIVAGTPQYMAPEQMLGTGIDHRTDLFAVGATFYELATGLPPFRGLERNGPPPSPGKIRPLPPSLERAILWPLQLDPSKRPQSAFDLLRTLRGIRHELERHPQYADQMQPETATPATPTSAQAKAHVEARAVAETAPLPRPKVATPPSNLDATPDLGANADLTDIIDDLDDYSSRSNDSLDQLLAVYLDEEKS